MRRVEGRRSVLAALRAGKVERIYLADGARTNIIEEIVSAAEAARVEVERVPRGRLDGWSETGSHQGVIADARESDRLDWRLAVSDAREAGQVPLLLALDGIQDPQNLGAIIRSAAAFGAHAVIIPGYRAASITPTVAKASAGAVEHIPVEVVASLQPMLEDAKRDGLWVIALAEEGAEPLERCALLEEPCVIVVGAEGKGVSRTIRNLADATVAIPTDPGFPTLNASVAAAVTLYATTRARPPRY